jgi:tRNA A-37 threonylcarbamoyl transferase component Bud32
MFREGFGGIKTGEKTSLEHHLGRYVIDFFPDQDGESPRWNEYLKYIEDVVNDEENFFDKGGAGRLYEFGPQGVCIKMMKERHHSTQSEMFRLGNSVSSEAWFLDRVSYFDIEGVRSPVFVEYFDGQENVGIVMEKLDAVNVQHILNGTALVPDGFSLDDFFDRLEVYIAELHDQKHICHGDLEARNIMIDRKTGMPRVIDFGRSVYTAAIDAHTRRLLESQDIKNIDRVKESMRSLMPGRAN